MADTRKVSLVEEIADRCVKLLSAGDWDRVYAALAEMHDQLREDIPDEEEFCVFFPQVVARLIDRLGDRPIGVLAQAQVYANSADPVQRADAGAWIKQHYRAS